MDPLLIVAGLGIGLLVGMTGMGGGSLMTPILILLFGTAPTTAIGSDIAYAAVTKTVGGWRHFRPGIWIGSHLTVRLPTALLRNALGIVMVLSALALFDEAGIELPLAIVIAIPVAFAAALVAQALVRRSRAMDTASSHT
jgi:uncharacterized protein